MLDAQTNEPDQNDILRVFKLNYTMFKLCSLIEISWKYWTSSNVVVKIVERKNKMSAQICKKVTLSLVII